MAIVSSLAIALLLSASSPLQATEVQTAEVSAGDAQAAREAAFAELLTGSRLVGYFTMDGEGKPELRGDSYTLKSVSKKEGDLWTFEAQIEYGERVIPIKMDLPVLWAGNTPMISVDDMGFPFLGKYSARILFDEGQYSGLWRGKGYGGQMFGRVEKIVADEDGESAPLPTPEDTDDQASVESDTNWPSFRGRYARGVAEGFATAIEWNVEQGDGVLWRAEVPGLAHSSPVIWGDRLFVTTAVRRDGKQDLRVRDGGILPVEDESQFNFEVHAYDKRSGELLWAQKAWDGVPEIKRHPKGSHAASTPTTDGKRVVAFFGSEGLYCYSVGGELLWKKEMGSMDSGFYLVPDAQWGFSSSPILFQDRVILQCDIQGDSFLTVLDANNGEELWRTERDEVPTWSSPTVDVRDGRAQVICNGFKHIGGYDLETGEELWRIAGGGDIPVPTPVVADGLIYITNAHGQGAPIYAVATSASGALAADASPEEGLAWGQARRGNYMQTPLVYGEQAYFCNDAGVLTCLNAKTGESIYRERLGAGRSGFTGSGIAADGKLYFSSEEGDVYVVDGWAFDLLSINPLGEECMASPAVSEGVLYYRTRGHIVAIGME